MTSVRPEGDIGAWRAMLAGLCASLVGVGLARFGYSPLIPALIAADWFTPAQAAYLGAANLAGYLAGALLAQRLAARLSAVGALRTAMLLATAAFFACAYPLPFLWFFAWRFAAGLAGAILIVLAAPTILPHVPPERRGLVSGAIFTGVGLGIVASGTLVPVLLRLGLFETWNGLGALGTLLTFAAWKNWPRDDRLPASAAKTQFTTTSNLPLKALLVEYGLNAVGLVPHMVFLVDFIARQLGQGVDVGAGYWVLFGIGAIIGPTVIGYVADRVGFKIALRVTYAVQAIMVSLVVVSDQPAALIVSSFVMGAFVPGISVLVLGRIHELLPGRVGHAAAWSAATIAFSIGQAAAAYGFSFLIGRGNYLLLFELAAAALLFAFVITLTANARHGKIADW